MAVHLLSFLQSLRRRYYVWKENGRKLLRSVLISIRNRMAFLCGRPNPWAAPIADGTLVFNDASDLFERYDALLNRWVVIRSGSLYERINAILNSRP